MAPLSRLLVYYVRENGEGITDSLKIPVQPDFENKVGEQKETLLFELIYFEWSFLFSLMLTGQH